IPEEISATILLEMLESIAPLHALRRKHRNIRPWTIAISSSGTVNLLSSPGLDLNESSEGAGEEEMHDKCYWTPEKLMGSSKDGTEQDIWAIGCIWAEMMTGARLFEADDSAGLLYSMFKILGFPSRKQVKEEKEEERELKGTDLDNMMPIGKTGLDLLRRLLEWCPHERLGAVQALRHPYF
ncbi:hypothetical protein GUITHDRAFT_48934, partial [Guillardia theta CCMP2712]